jgi:hypothetical protein
VSATGDGAVISPCETYRYVLWRSLTPVGDEALSAGTVLWICLNPSTADASKDDATLRKICGFSRRWRFGHVRLVNLYALRSREPKALWKHADPIGPENDAHIVEESAQADAIVFAWGGNAEPERARRVTDHVSTVTDGHVPVWNLGLTGGEQPMHPLMLSYSTLRKEHF